MAKPANTYFDRRVPEQLLEVLQPGGFAHSLVQYGRSGQYGLDVGLRSIVKDAASHATLYVGTTKAVDLDHRPGQGFRLLTAGKWKQKAKHRGTRLWQPDWEQRHGADWWAARWSQVEAFIEACIGAVPRSYLIEGVVQAGVSRFGSRTSSCPRAPRIL